MKSLDTFASGKLTAIDARSQRRHLFDHTRRDQMQAHRNGVGDVISFTDNDYLGLSTHPDVIAVANEAAIQYGAGSGASRLVTGNHPLYRELEKKIAKLKGTEDALVFGSGYMANTGIIPTLVGKDDLIIADELIHTSLHAGIKLSGAKTLFFRHNDVDHAKELLRANRHNHPHAMMLVDGVYSMDGDIAPLKQLGQVAKVFDCWLMSDDAHGVGVIGGGKGSAHACGAENLVPLQMGTMSKAVGSYGGYLAASHQVCELLRSRCRSLIYTTGLPPATVAASIKALDIITHNPDICARPVQLAQKFAAAMGLPKPETAIVPLIVGAEDKTLMLSRQLAERGYLAWAFRPPTVPEGSSRLRFCFSSTHTDDQLNGLIKTCRDIGLGTEIGQ